MGASGPAVLRKAVCAAQAGRPSAATSNAGLEDGMAGQAGEPDAEDHAKHRQDLQEIMIVEGFGGDHADGTAQQPGA